jgi:hypothetical protein
MINGTFHNSAVSPPKYIRARYKNKRGKRDNVIKFAITAFFYSVGFKIIMRARVLRVL